MSGRLPCQFVVIFFTSYGLLTSVAELHAQSSTKEPPLVAPFNQPPQGRSPVPVIPSPPPNTAAGPVFGVVPIVGTPCPVDPPAPIVVVRVRVVACSPADREIRYQICVENLSPAAAHHVLVRNPMPANAVFVRANPKPKISGSELQWPVGTLPGCSRCFIELVLQPNGPGDVLNCARVQFEHGQCVLTRIVRAAPHMPPAPGQVQPGTTKPPPKIKPKDEKKPDVKLRLEISGPEQAAVGAEVIYKITLTNDGPDAAAKSLISIVVPKKMKYIRSSEGGKHVMDKTAWFLGTIDPGKNRSVAVTYEAAEAEEICPVAEAQADYAEDVTARMCTKFTGAAGMKTEGFDTVDPIVVGEQTSYVIVVTNQGQVPATNIQVRALLPADKMSFVSATAQANHEVKGTVQTGQEVTFAPLSPLSPGAAARYEIRVKAEAKGTVKFRAEITADQFTSGRPVVEEDSTTIEAPEGPTGPVVLQGIIPVR